MPRWLPWLLGGLMLVVYWATLNHWVTLLNVDAVAAISGWTWQPVVTNPLTFLVMLPFRCLPTPHVPLALNAFSALCAAGALAVLARTVAILPHDRTDLERWRERSDFSFLTGWAAWIPPVAAVFFAGFHLGFWENATSFSRESFDVLWFAVILWQLLEYRLDEHEGRLYFVAVLYGMGLAENWALLAFFPVFLVMLIWLRKLSFFEGQFLGRMVLGGLAGFLVLLLLVVPLVAKFSGAYPVGFWEAIKYNLRIDWQVLRLVQVSQIRQDLALISLVSLLPAFVMSFRWSASFGDSSRLGASLVNYFMHVVNAVLLGMLVWVAFDPPFSPARVLAATSFSIPALTLYYVAAVCIGYYSGYFLVIFGKPPVPSRRTAHPDPALPAGLLWLCPVIVAAAMAGLLIGAGLLLYKNTPAVLARNDDSLGKYGRFSTQQLPAQGAILLCDSDDTIQDMPLRAYLVQAELAREGRQQLFPVVDTKALPYTSYQSYLHRRFPTVWPDTYATNKPAEIDPLHLLGLLDHLAKSNNLCYLNPSFGYYFEEFYQEPHGMVYHMKTLPADTLLPPAMDTNLTAENEAFWKQVMASSGPAVDQAQHPVDLAQKDGLIGWFMEHLHVQPDVNPNALVAGAYYSKSLNFVGVQAQRAGQLSQAAEFFSDAQAMNSNNVVTSVNLAFNQTLKQGAATAVDLSHVTADQFGKYRGWSEVLGANGPFDETSFCFGQGCWLMQARLPRQATALFDRVRQLAPNNLPARLFLAQIYILNHRPDSALEALHDPLAHPPRFALTDYNSTELNEMVAAAHFLKGQVPEGVSLLEQEMNRHPDDEKLLLTAAQTFNMLHLHTNALEAINRKLSHTPNDPNWLFGKGVVSLEAGAYGEAAEALSKFLETQTNHPAALFDRGLAYLQGGNLDGARADFLRLQATYTNSFQVAYNLGEIARQQHQTNDAIRNYRLYLAGAPTNAPEIKAVREHLSQLGGK